MKKLLFFALAAATLIVAGCAEQNAEYEQEVDLTPEQKAQAEQNMAGQQAPGQIDPGQPVEPLSMPPGKSGG